VLTLMDVYGGGIAVLFIAIAECISLLWIYGNALWLDFAYFVGYLFTCFVLVVQSASKECVSVEVLRTDEAITTCTQKREDNRKRCVCVCEREREREQGCHCPSNRYLVTYLIKLIFVIKET